MHDIVTSVFRAFADSGRRKLATPLRDRFESGQRRATIGVGAQQRDEGEAHQDAGAFGSEVVVDEVVLQRQRDAVQRAVDLLVDAEDDHRRHHQDVEVRREGEVTPGLLESTKVAVDEDQDDADGDQQWIGVRANGRQHARQDRGARRTLDRDRDRVINEERDGGDLGDLWPKVVARHDVGPTGGRVVLDDVHVTGRDEEEHAEDHEHDRHYQRERGDANERRHLGEDLLGAVGRGRDAVRRQDAEGDRAIEPFAAQLLGHERLSKEESLDPVAQGLGVDVGQIGVGRQQQRIFGNLVIGL